MNKLYFLLSIFSLCLPLIARAENAEEAQFERWVSDNAVTVPLVDGSQSLPGLDQLDRLVAGKKIIFLGEPDHYISEKYDYRLLFIRHLITRGFSHIGMEMGRSDGRKVNAYLQTGDTRFLTLCLYDKTRCARPDRDDEPSGQFHEPGAPLFAPKFASEETWFYRQLGALAPFGTLNFFGFDVDFPAGGSYDDVAELLSPYSESARVKDFLRSLARVNGESMAEETARLTACLSKLDAEKGKFQVLLGARLFEDVHQSVESLRDSFQFLQVAFNNPTENQLHAAYTLREQLALLPEGEGIILMGHNMHLSKTSAELAFGEKSHPREPMWYSIGSFLQDSLPGQVFSVWLTYNQGTHWAVGCTTASCPVTAVPDRMEALLSKAKGGSSFWLSTHAVGSGGEYLDQIRNFNQNGEYGSGKVRDNADLLFFVDTANVTHERE